MKKLILLMAFILTSFINAYSQGENITITPTSSYLLIANVDTFTCYGYNYNSPTTLGQGNFSYWSILDSNGTQITNIGVYCNGCGGFNFSSTQSGISYTVGIISGGIGQYYYWIKLHRTSQLYKCKVNFVFNNTSTPTNDVLKWTTSLKYLSTGILTFTNTIHDTIIRVSTDSVYSHQRINWLIPDSIAFRNDSLKIISLLDTIYNTTKSPVGLVTQVLNLKTDTTNKGIQIVNLNSRHISDSIAFLNKHDTVYIVSSITSDTLKISIHTGISSASPMLNSLKVYPNPSSTILHIDLEKTGYFTAKISGVTGQSIITPTSGTIDISALANGIYILTIYDSNGKLISTNKISISK